MAKPKDEKEDPIDSPPFDTSENDEENDDDEDEETGEQLNG